MSLRYKVTFGRLEYRWWTFLKLKVIDCVAFCVCLLVIVDASGRILPKTCFHYNSPPRRLRIKGKWSLLSLIVEFIKEAFVIYQKKLMIAEWPVGLRSVFNNVPMRMILLSIIIIAFIL